jgi:hypothetical protein
MQATNRRPRFARGGRSTTMHVYLREEPIDLEMREVEPEGLIPDDSELIPVAFFAGTNDAPSFRAFLPPETVAILHQVIHGPVKLGLMAEEPEPEATEFQAMVGVAIPADQLPTGMPSHPDGEDDEEDEMEPWRTAAPGADWRGEEGDDDTPRTLMLAFAPLVRIGRRCPHDFGDELADLLESALAGATRPSLEARVERMLGL